MAKSKKSKLKVSAKSYAKNENHINIKINTDKKQTRRRRNNQTTKSSSAIRLQPNLPIYLPQYMQNPPSYPNYGNIPNPNYNPPNNNNNPHLNNMYTAPLMNVNNAQNNNFETNRLSTQHNNQHSRNNNNAENRQGFETSLIRSQPKVEEIDDEPIIEEINDPPENNSPEQSVSSVPQLENKQVPLLEYFEKKPKQKRGEALQKRNEEIMRPETKVKKQILELERELSNLRNDESLQSIKQSKDKTSELIKATLKLSNFDTPTQFQTSFSSLLEQASREDQSQNASLELTKEANRILRVLKLKQIPGKVVKYSTIVKRLNDAKTFSSNTDLGRRLFAKPITNNRTVSVQRVRQNPTIVTLDDLHARSSSVPNSQTISTS